MPNLQLLLSLKEKFSNLSYDEVKTKEFIERKRIKSEPIKKAFSFDERRLIESFDLSNYPSDLINYFESSPNEEVVLLFVDVTGFSSIVKGKSASYLKSYLDYYYSVLIPIIYKHKGQVEKTMGDGIIIVFGKPFTNYSSMGMNVANAENCAKEAIEKFKGSDKAVKVALHMGKITYYKIPSESYEEYTMIGSPLTELYRLESVSVGDAINFYKGSIYDNFNPADGMNIFTDIKRKDVTVYRRDITLSGVSYNQLRYIKFI